MKRTVLWAISLLVAFVVVAGCERTEKRVEEKTTTTTEQTPPATTTTTTPAPAQ